MGGSWGRAFDWTSLGMWLLAGLSVACRTSAPASRAPREAQAQKVASVHDSASPSEQLARREMFERLVADIRAYHLFPDAWPEERWVAELPALQRAVTGAVDRAALLVALSHMA